MALSRPQNKSNIFLTLATVVAGVFVLVPLFSIAYQALFADSGVWQHWLDHLLGRYVSSSLLLTLGVAFGVLLLGLPTAALVSLCDFPGRKTFSLLLLLPLAAPAYILAYTYTALLDVAGPLAGIVPNHWFEAVRSLPGAAVMLSLVLYPYVYLLARATFVARSTTIIEAGRTLGLTSRQAFWRIALPVARPAIVAGLTLALMETLADYGTVQFFGVPTFTTGIMRTFYGLGDRGSAAQLALVLLTFVVVLIVMERYSRRKIRYFGGRDETSSPVRVPLSGTNKWLALVVCALPVVFGLGIPLLALAYWSLFEARDQWADLLPMALGSFTLAGTAALVVVGFSLLLAYSKRLRPTVLSKAIHFGSGLGYALPGTVVAIGLLVPLGQIDQHLFLFARDTFGVNVGLVLTGTFGAMLLAYFIRFSAVSLGAIDSGLARIKPSLDDACRLAGLTWVQTLKRVHVPLLTSSVFTALLVVFVDVLKELPATLVLRPFNFNTLAVRAFELAGDERLIDAAPASLAILLVGLVPVILLNRFASEAH